MTITLGDEFQMVVQSKNDALDIIESLKEKMTPLSFYLVISPYYKKINKDHLSKNITVNPLLCPIFKKAHTALDSKQSELTELKLGTGCL